VKISNNTWPSCLGIIPSKGKVEPTGSIFAQLLVYCLEYLKPANIFGGVGFINEKLNWDTVPVNVALVGLVIAPVVDTETIPAEETKGIKNKAIMNNCRSIFFIILF
jgi:hypothetical protein